MPAPAKEVELVRVGLVELRRLFQRSELAKEWAAAFGRARKLDYTELRLLDAVRSSTTRASADEGATVGEIAERLGIDPSRASRLVARSVARGTLSRHASAGDGRRVVLQVTDAGLQLQDRGSELTRSRVALWRKISWEDVRAEFSMRPWISGPWCAGLCGPCGLRWWSCWRLISGLTCIANPNVQARPW